MKSWTSDKVFVKPSPNKGFGIFAKEKIDKGELLVLTVGQILTTEQVKSHPMPYHCYQIEFDLQQTPVDLSSLSGIFTTNHSCSPNAGLRNACSLVAIKDIQPGEEICFDYVMSDCTLGEEPTVVMDCKCGSENCRKTITDKDWRIPELQQKYKGYFSTYLQEIISNLNPSS